MSILADLEKLSSAEDFFSYLKVDYDPARLRVARLHILKRMGKYLAAKDFSAAGEDRIYEEARETLTLAYRDFAESSPIDQRVFKVLQDHDPSRPSRRPRQRPRPSCPSTS